MTEESRTLTQNAAMHLYFTMLGDALNDAGYDMKKTLKPQVEIPWEPKMVKKYLWKPIQEVMFDKESTTKLAPKQVDEVYRVLSRHISEKFGINVEFPTRFNEGQ